MRSYTPRPHQAEITRWILEHERCNIWAGMGSGKTVATLTALEGLYGMVGGYGPTLVLGPLRVVQSVWPAEARLWAHLAGLRVIPVVGSAAERAAALRLDAEVYCTNYDNLPWLSDHVGKDWPFEIVVSDEARRLKGFRLRQGSLRAGRLGRVAHTKVRRWVNLTGTPATNGYLDLWGQQWFVDAGQALGLSYDSFESRWFAWKRKGTSRFAKDLVLLDHTREQIEEKMKPTTIAITNALGVDAPVFNDVYVDLPDDARLIYRDMERRFLAEIEGREVEAFNAAAKSMKCLQLANGFVFTNPDTDGGKDAIDVHDAKLDALDSIVAEAAGMPVLVACQFVPDKARILKRFPEARELDTNPRTIDEWNAGEIPMMVVHPKSGGHGLNLQHGSNVIAFFGLWWDLEEYLQVIERIGPTRQKQSGYDRPVFVHHVLARGTVDEDVLLRLRTKDGVQATLLAGMKARQQ